jgi:hypothetical protein
MREACVKNDKRLGWRTRACKRVPGREGEVRLYREGREMMCRKIVKASRVWCSEGGIQYTGNCIRFSGNGVYPLHCTRQSGNLIYMITFTRKLGSVK